ncbi:hypothetical protein SPV_2492 [Streptococcus pneumoniae]|nr:hypothetical protein SPV_2492 [Streptococcus pneumoniae]
MKKIMRKIASLLLVLVV